LGCSATFPFRRVPLWKRSFLSIDEPLTNRSLPFWIPLTLPGCDLFRFPLFLYKPLLVWFGNALLGVFSFPVAIEVATLFLRRSRAPSLRRLRFDDTVHCPPNSSPPGRKGMPSVFDILPGFSLLTPFKQQLPSLCITTRLPPPVVLPLKSNFSRVVLTYTLPRRYRFPPEMVEIFCDGRSTSFPSYPPPSLRTSTLTGMRVAKHVPLFFDSGRFRLIYLKIPVFFPPPGSCPRAAHRPALSFVFFSPGQIIYDSSLS